MENSSLNRTFTPQNDTLTQKVLRWKRSRTYSNFTVWKIHPHILPFIWRLRHGLWIVESFPVSWKTDKMWARKWIGGIISCVVELDGDKMGKLNKIVIIIDLFSFTCLIFFCFATSTFRASPIPEPIFSVTNAKAEESFLWVSFPVRN